MQLFLYLMTTSIILIMENDGIQLMSLLDGSFLECSNCTTASFGSELKGDRNTTPIVPAGYRNTFASENPDFDILHRTEADETEQRRIRELWDPVLNQSFEFSILEDYGNEKQTRGSDIKQAKFKYPLIDRDKETRLKKCCDPVHSKSSECKSSNQTCESQSDQITPRTIEGVNSTLPNTYTSYYETERSHFTNSTGPAKILPKSAGRFGVYSLKVHLFLTRRPLYGKIYSIFATMPSLGNEIFVLSLTVDTKDYLIDELVTTPNASQTKWKYTSNLGHVLRKWRIFASHLPYTKCYVYQTTATFFNPEHSYVIAKVSSHSSGELLADVQYWEIKVRRPPDIPCLPGLSLPYCKDPDEPVIISNRKHVAFFAVLKGDCTDFQYHHIRWDLFDSREKKLLLHLGVTKGLLLKLPPYVYDTGEVFMIRACAKVNDVLTVARCYVQYSPPLIEVRIHGNDLRRVDVRKKVVIDGSWSRDRIKEKESIDTKNFNFGCSSLDDAANPYCHLDMSFTPIIRLPENTLKEGSLYNISLTVSSRSDPHHRQTGYQIIHGVATRIVTPHIFCLRNCQMRVYAPIETTHLSGGCLDCTERIVRYEWWVKADDNKPILESEQNFLVLRHQAAKLVIRLKLVLESQVSGVAVLTLRRNNGPQDGSCVIWPSDGIAAVTPFRINCMGFQTPYKPITIRYRIDMTAIVTHLSFKRYETLLPETDKLSIFICDAIDMCVHETLNVTVYPFELKDPRADFEHRIQEIMCNVSDFLKRGNWNTAFIRALAATKYIKSAHHGRMIYSDLSEHQILTTSQLEKLSVLAYEFLLYLRPVDYKGAGLLAEVFSQMSGAFELVISDREFLHRDAYDSLTAMCMSFMTVLGTTSEKHSMAMCKPYDPECINVQMLELEQRFAIEFDPLILIRINHWMMNTWFLYLCVYYLGVVATRRHHAYDEALTVYTGGIAYQVNVTEVVPPIKALTLKTIDNIHVVELSAQLLRDLSKRLNHTSILLQVISQQNYHNIFWWYPDPMPSKTSVLIIHVCSPVAYFKTAEDYHLKHPVVYRTNITEFNDDAGFGKWMSNGSIYNTMQVNYYSLMLDHKAMLAVRVVSCSEPMRVKMRLHKRPSPKELKDEACLITPQMKGKRIWMANFCDRSYAFVSIYRPGDYQSVQRGRARRHAEKDRASEMSPLNYSILLEIHQCNVWVNRSLDPGWSPDFCQTTFEHSYGTSVQCTCHILGSLASRIFPILSTTYVDVIPLPILATKVLVAMIFLLLLLLLIGVLVLSMGTISAHQRQQNFLQCDGGKIKVSREPATEPEILLVVVTGGQEFAGTTSNIKLYLKSPHRQQTSYQITQDPGHPRILRNTTNKMLVPRGSIHIPTRLALGIEANGRYPSWYCRTVTVVDLELKVQQLFVIEKWIEPGHTRFMRSKYFTIGSYRCTPQYTWWKRFRNRFEQLYISWFMGNPITGPWQNSIGGWTMNRLERCSVLICKIAITLALISVFFGRSSAESIQEAQRIYGDSSIELSEVVALSFYAFIIGCFVHLFFEIIILRWLCMQK